MDGGWPHCSQTPEGKGLALSRLQGAPEIACARNLGWRNPLFLKKAVGWLVARGPSRSRIVFATGW